MYAKKKIASLGLLLVLGLMSVIAIMPTKALTPTPTCPPDSSKYGFESVDVFWVKQTYIDSQAVTAVAQSKRGMAKFGCYSLQLTVDLVSGHENKSKGEAYVDMRFFAPTGVNVPVNLEGVRITAWVYVPGDAAGDPESPNGVQIFVKDNTVKSKSEYATWFNLRDYTDRWIRISLSPSREAPPDGYMDSGFDPTKIIIIGIKIGTGKNSIYRGPIYIDGVNW